MSNFDEHQFQAMNFLACIYAKTVIVAVNGSNQTVMTVITVKIIFKGLNLSNQFPNNVFLINFLNLFSIYCIFLILIKERNLKLSACIMNLICKMQKQK